jgi:hypothetical protein
LPDFDEVQLPGADLFGSQRCRGAPEVFREGADLLQVRALGIGREIANAHILDHPLT